MAVKTVLGQNVPMTISADDSGLDMQIWLIDRWTGTPVNAAPDEHDAVAARR